MGCWIGSIGMASDGPPLVASGGLGHRGRKGGPDGQNEEHSGIHLADHWASGSYRVGLVALPGIARHLAGRRLVEPRRYSARALRLRNALDPRRLRRACLLRPHRAAASWRHPHLVAVRAITSFTTYALSHNIGASVFSGALVRYRAYTAKGLSAPQVAVLVALCSFTFALGTVVLGGLVLVLDPNLLTRVEDRVPAALANPVTARVIGLVLLGFVALYVIGSILHLRPLVVRKFKLEYPRPGIMIRQLVAAPLELLGAAGIIYFALPEANNPGFMIVLGAFLFSFSAALVSHAPGGLGVLELFFIAMMPDVPKPTVLAALLVFRIFYLIIPFIMAIVVVLMFERARLAKAWRDRVQVPRFRLRSRRRQGRLNPLQSRNPWSTLTPAQQFRST